MGPPTARSAARQASARYRDKLIDASQAKKDTRDGVVAGLIAYTLWGVLPVYFKAVAIVPATEILLHRIIWAIPFGALIIYLRRQWPEVKTALTHPAMMRWLTLTAALIAVNWFIYIIAVQTDRIFQASLGYYINPLLFVLAGVIFFGERLRNLQLVAVGFATIGVLVLTISGGEFPWISLAIGMSFAVYGVIRKRVVIGAMPGLFVETLLLFPIALAWLTWMTANGNAVFGSVGPAMTGLILLSGPVTVVPLIMFAIAARRLDLSTIGFMQFLAPSMHFMAGVYYGEALTWPRITCFIFIWAAVIVFITDALRRQKGARA